eukprot:CAMPEP_0198263192 /NCGR_PEP_ID=MMETSP1447-20131203/11589_1 /TAXON_ID=420782 /ORGANISM="Chaetoceros dichaeta, Strain CCMP1751" /LENGTH=251 /DNA_ID=CAMNT_0043951705 /DNA_START=121 /DNA_END=872 /DNA_ORIENTATION=-
MSLNNFVSSSVLSSTDGVSHNTETPIEHPSGDSSTITSTLYRSSSNQAPLFEQLRKNQQEAQDNYDEVTKAMRGTRTLDDEDVAHLQSVEDVRVDRDREVQRNVDEELEMFRAAKMEKGMTVTVAAEDVGDADADADDGGVGVGVESKNSSLNERTKPVTSLTSLWSPQIIVTKKRRRKVPASGTAQNEDGSCTKKVAVVAAVGNSTLESNLDQTKMNKKETLQIHKNSSDNNLVSAGAGSNGKEVFGGLL